VTLTVAGFRHLCYTPPELRRIKTHAAACCHGRLLS
jgi:hypothetical protein